MVCCCLDSTFTMYFISFRRSLHTRCRLSLSLPLIYQSIVQKVVFIFAMFAWLHAQVSTPSYFIFLSLDPLPVLSLVVSSWLDLAGIYHQLVPFPPSFVAPWNGQFNKSRQVRRYVLGFWVNASKKTVITATPSKYFLVCQSEQVSSRKGWSGGKWLLAMQKCMYVRAEREKKRAQTGVCWEGRGYS